MTSVTVACVVEVTSSAQVTATNVTKTATALVTLATASIPMFLTTPTALTMTPVPRETSASTVCAHQALQSFVTIVEFVKIKEFAILNQVLVSIQRKPMERHAPMTSVTSLNVG